MKLRRLACEVMERWGRWIAGLGLSAVIAFVAAVVAVAAGWIGPRGYAVAAAASLAVLGACLAAGRLGDPEELRRRASA